MAMLLPKVAIDDGMRPQPESVSLFENEEAEIKSFLWPFDNNSEPQTLQDIGFELNLTPEMIYLFISSSFSSHFMREVIGKKIESMPNNRLLQQPSQLLQIYAVNRSEEEPIGNQERVLDGSPMPSGAAKQKKSNRATKKSMQRRNVDDDSWMPEGWVKKVNQRPFKGKFPGYVDKIYYAPGVRRAFRSKIEALRYIQELRNATTVAVSRLRY